MINSINNYTAAEEICKIQKYDILRTSPLSVVTGLSTD